MTAIPKPLYVAIVDDCPIVVLGVTALLRPFGRLVRIASHANRFPNRGRAHIVLYDPFVSPNTLERLHEIGQQTGACVVAFSTTIGQAQTDEAMAAGAAGVLSKTVDGSTMMTVLEAAAKERAVFVAPDRTPPKSRWPGDQEGLDSRESAVMSQIVAGLSTEDIAEALHWTGLAVQVRLSSAYKKLGITSRAQAVSWGIAHGFQLVAPAVRVGAGAQR